MKRSISIMIVALMCLTMVAGCSQKKSNRPFDYDLSKYITLGEYTGIEYTYKVAETTEESVNAYIKNALSEKGYGEAKEVTDRAVQNGDTVNIDFVGTKDGVAFEGGTAQGQDLVIGSNTYIPGFESGLVGVKKGEKVNLNLTFPEDYGNEELNGAAVVFEVTVNKITQTVYPELTDEIVKELSKDHTTVDAYKKFVNDEVTKTNKDNAEQQKEAEIWNKVVENATVKSLPKDELDHYKKLLLESYDDIANEQYGMTYEQFLSQMGKTLEDEDIVKGLNEQAEAAVKNYMVIVSIAREQNLDFTDAEYQEQLDTYAKSGGYTTTQQFIEAIDEEQFYLSLLVEKVTKYVVDNAVEKK